MYKVLIVLLCGSLLIASCSTQGNTQSSTAITTQIVTEGPIRTTPTIASPIPGTPTVTSQPTTPPPTSTETSLPALSPTATTFEAVGSNSQAVIIDHTSVALFEKIPERYLTAARNLRMMYSDRSVGQNINEYLDCLTASSWESSPSRCRYDYADANWNTRTFTLADKLSGKVAARILFDPDPGRYNRENWTFDARGGSWTELTQNFVETLAPSFIDSKDVLSYQFTYLNVTEGDDIADPNTGFFADNPDKYDVYDLEAYISSYPQKTFFFWTTSLARSIGSQTAQSFNDQMRQYALAHNKFLFDVADIESYTDQGDACYDNRDGVKYCSKDNCEDYPDDGLDLPAICQDYTSEIDGGHLGSVSGGGIRLAKAFWVLMARIAGWDGVSN